MVYHLLQWAASEHTCVRMQRLGLGRCALLAPRVAAVGVSKCDQVQCDNGVPDSVTNSIVQLSRVMHESDRC